MPVDRTFVKDLLGIHMTLDDIKREMVFRTGLRIEEMKGRQFDVPKGKRAFSRLYDRLTDEILDYAIQQLAQIIDKNHLRYEVLTLMSVVENELGLLVSRVPEILLANNRKQGGSFNL